MTDFEIQRRLRDLRGAREPGRDLWPSIAARIAAEEQPAASRRGWLPLAAAAALAIAGATGGLLLILQQQHRADVASRDTGMPTFEQSRDIARSLGQANGSDPRLAGAAIVLDAAHAELHQALEQQPDAVFLVGLINRTNEQRLKLARFGSEAG